MEVKRALAYVPDDPPLFDDLSVGQHLDFIGKLYQIDNHVEKSKQLLVDFDLTQKINAGASTLSRGMRQKAGDLVRLPDRPKSTFAGRTADRTGSARNPPIARVRSSNEPRLAQA